MRAALLALGACGRVGFDPIVVEPLDVSAPVARVNLNTVVALVPAGGVPPYQFAVTAGLGEVDTEGGFRCGTYASTSTIEVSDSVADAASISIECGGDRLFAAGGMNDSGTRAEVWSSSDGAQWTQSGALPVPRVDGCLLVYDDHLFYIGGADVTDGIGSSEVLRSRDGATWTVIGNLPATREFAGCTVFRGRLIVSGGSVAPATAVTTTVWSSVDGITWTDEPPLPVPIHGHVLMRLGDELLLVAGHELNGHVATVRAFDGMSWRTVGALPAAGEYIATTFANGLLWVAGGTGLFARVLVSADGVTWSDVAALPAPRANSAGMFSHRGEIWIVGGNAGQPVHALDGSQWTPAGAFPAGQLSWGSYAQFTPP